MQAGTSGASGASGAAGGEKMSVAIEKLVEETLRRCYVELRGALRRAINCSDIERKEKFLKAVLACKQKLIRLFINIEWSEQNVS